MKVQIEKSKLVNALEKMYNVSTKSLVPDFNETGRVTIEVKSKKVFFTSSNGHLVANFEVNEGISHTEDGKITTDSIKLRNSIKSLPAETIELNEAGGMVIARDPDSKRKKLVRLPCYSEHHKKTQIRRPNDSERRCFETDLFFKAIKTVAPFQLDGEYKPHYQCLCIHWLSKETRFVCGDGSIFIVFKLPKNPKDESFKEVKRVASVDQFLIISSLIEGSKEIELFWGNKDDSVFYLTADNGLELILKGIPRIDYISYDNNAFRFSEATAYVDIRIEDLSEAAALIGSLRDQEKIKQGKTHSCFFNAASNKDFMEFEITSKQGKFQCEFEIPVSYYNINNTPKFSAAYAHLFLDRFVQSSSHEYIRFYLIDETGISCARNVDLLEEKDRNGIPEIRQNSDACEMSFFFLAMRDISQMEDDDDNG